MKLTIYALSILLASLTFSCRTKDGAPGPAGAAGTSGTAGTPGASDLIKQGSINGSISYNDADDKLVSHAFDYQYFISRINDNSFTYDVDKTSYNITLNRTDVADDNQITFSFSGEFEDGIPVEPTEIALSFDLREESSNQIYAFSTYYRYFSPAPSGEGESVYDITNYSFNETTGVLSFDYEITFTGHEDSYNNAQDNPATLKGSVKVTLQHNPYSNNK